MKANQFYRQWITDYRIEKNDRSGEPIQDGDLLDWLAEKFESGEFKQLNKPVVMQGCQCKDRIGETKVWCCNQCGLPCQDFWLPTHYTVGSRTVGKAGEDASVIDGK